MEIVTKDEFNSLAKQLKEEIIQELFLRIRDFSPKEPQTNKIKSGEVLKLLQISHGTLQSMRNSNQVKFTKIRGTIYYDREEILRILGSNFSQQEIVS